MSEFKTIKDIIEDLTIQYEDGVVMTNDDTQLLLAALYFYWRCERRYLRFKDLMPDEHEKPSPVTPDEEDED